MGPNATLDNIKHFVALPIGCLIASALSFAFGAIGTRLFDLPMWLTPSMIYNNAISLPLLLIKALAVTGGLDEILDILPNDTAKTAVARGKIFAKS